MKNIIEEKVYYADTDAYGVVWHGTYLRWLEKGRVEYCEQIGHKVSDLKEQDILLPVVNMNVKYKASAKLDDELIIETWLEKFNGFVVSFGQKISSKTNNQTFIEATFDVVAISNDGKLYRRMPTFLAEVFKKEIAEQCPTCV